MSFHNVYLVTYWGMPSNHQSIFVEFEDEGPGILYHIIGKLSVGFTYERKESQRPSESRTFSGMELLGRVESSKMDTFEKVCKSITVPSKQHPQNHNIFKPPKGCQWWVNEATKALEAKGLLRPSIEQSQSTSAVTPGTTETQGKASTRDTASRHALSPAPSRTTESIQGSLFPRHTTGGPREETPMRAAAPQPTSAEIRAQYQQVKAKHIPGNMLQVRTRHGTVTIKGWRMTGDREVLYVEKERMWIYVKDVTK